LTQNPENRKHKTSHHWWNFLSREQRTDLRHLAEKPVPYQDQPTWSKKNIDDYFAEHKDFLEAQHSYLKAVHSNFKEYFPRPDPSAGDLRVFCPECGEEAGTDEKICARCGTTIGDQPDV
jgi:hypothetical protein